MDCIFYFDVEDSVSPPEHGNDDVVLWIAQVLDRHGIKGSFHIIGDKVRCMAQRGRRDIFAALQRHDVSSHYNHGSVHPTTTARIAAADWDQGVAIAMEVEQPGFEQIERIAGRCSALTRHGGSYSPQAVHAAGRCGKVFYGVPFHPPGARAFWLAGTLCFSSTGLIFTDDNQAAVGYLEHLYEDTQKFDAQLERLRDALPQVLAQWEHHFTALFGSHPHRMNTTNYSCWNHYGGVNRQPPLPPPLRPEDQRQTIRANFERFVAFLASQCNLHFQGLSDLQRVYGSAPGVIEADDLQRYAQAVLDGDDVPLHDRFSPAEMLLALARGLDAPQRAYAVSPCLGPKTMPPPGAAVSITREQLQHAVQHLLQHHHQHQALPAVVQVDAAPLTPANLLETLSQALLDRSAPRFTTRPRSAYPRAADAWRPEIHRMAQWRVFPPELNMSSIADLTCAQAWSVKPAHRQ